MSNLWVRYKENNVLMWDNDNGNIRKTKCTPEGHHFRDHSIRQWFSAEPWFSTGLRSQGLKKNTMRKINVLEDIPLASSRTVSCHFKKLNQNAGYRFRFQLKCLLFHFHLKCQLKCHLVTVLLRREGKKTTKALHGALQFTFLLAH